MCEGAVTGEAFTTLASDYVALDQAARGADRYVTYANVTALLSGVTLRADGRYASAQASYTFGENLTKDRPLAEMAPCRRARRCASGCAWRTERSAEAVNLAPSCQD